ncbi:hypothetical protein [Streptomyces sp. NPDC006739]|uniref:hypothetical protein n=1 Tax=Streptomyces sp. NPDC006739 TaxID=3364763 RepID=UPI0036978B79
MCESLPVRCPDCRREHVYSAPAYPCPCGASVTPPLDPSADPARVEHPVWDEAWVTVACAACGRRDQWPHPELGCPCGTLLRVPVTTPATPAAPGRPPSRTPTTPSTDPAHPDPAHQAPDTPTPAARPAADPARPAFQPVAIRTALDAVTAAALYLRWLGYRDIRRADQRPPAGIGLAARGLLAQVDPTVRPASTRDVECLWLTAMTESAGCVYFSLAGYADDARRRADDLGVPLFVLDLTGTPQPVNAPADDLDAAGA